MQEVQLQRDADTTSSLHLNSPSHAKHLQGAGKAGAQAGRCWEGGLCQQSCTAHTGAVTWPKGSRGKSLGTHQWDSMAKGAAVFTEGNQLLLPD